VPVLSIGDVWPHGRMAAWPHGHWAHEIYYHPDPTFVVNERNEHARRATSSGPEPDLRTRILDASRTLFAARGFDGTTVQHIADACGVSKPGVLHHFRSKDAIRQAVLDELLAHWNEHLPRLLLEATASADRFDAVLGALIRFFGEHPNRARVVLREALDRPETVAALLAGAVKPWLDMVAAHIERGRRSGTHHADVDPDAYVFLILQFVLVAASSSTLATASLGEGAPERHVREFERIARASLFASRTTAHASET